MNIYKKVKTVVKDKIYLAKTILFFSGALITILFTILEIKPLMYAGILSMVASFFIKQNYKETYEPTEDYIIKED